MSDIKLNSGDKIMPAEKVEKETLMCEICYDSIEVDRKQDSAGNQVVWDLSQNIFKLQACSHTFCRECFQETYHSLITE